ncbi:hypothetical protein DERF_014544 [Dermatophagoides farinae]|uniref:Secreted protein n=1 Tax=Dermatophagoides farinae TaxID=6954 RepID=A0A922HP90_DERFA|nr:hypothetical protein DERF_014544 [Dermatophagoides farinae]
MKLLISLSLLGLLAKIKRVVSVLISLISDTTIINGQDIEPIFAGSAQFFSEIKKREHKSKYETMFQYYIISPNFSPQEHHTNT